MMKTERAGWKPAAVALLVASLILSCGDDNRQINEPSEPPELPPVPRSLVVSLATPYKNDSALLITISGGEVNSPVPVNSSHQLFFRNIDESTTRMVIVGGILEGEILSFGTSDVPDPEPYTVTLVEVADHQNELRPSLDGYELSVERTSGS